MIIITTYTIENSKIVSSTIHVDGNSNIEHKGLVKSALTDEETGFSNILHK